MKVVIDPKAGFCGGVKRAILLVEKALQEGDKVFVRGELIHNPREMKRLEALGLKISPEIDAGDEEAMFIRTHGETPEIYRLAKDKGTKIIDATCKNVRRSQKIIELEVSSHRKVYIFGKKLHPEVIGLLGYCRGNVVVIEKVEEFSLNTEDIPSLLIPQTTADPLKFAELQSKMSTVISDLKVYNAICPFVSKREKELRNFAKSCDAIIFVGGAHSSNTAVLFSVCKQVNPNSFFVEKPEDLPGEKLSQFELIGVSGSASTPMWQLEEIAEVISQKFIMNN